MGGPIATRTVLQDPGAFRGLILVDSFLSALPAAYMEPTITGLESNATVTLSVFMGHVSNGPEQNQRVVTEALRIPTAALQAYLRALTVDSIGGRQAQLRLPVLQLTAGRRELIPPGRPRPSPSSASRACRPSA
ncbi:MAG: hypothetical protein IPO28_01880 [Holophagaceae bacterium]|nr:hypothetical protein [Holophagaceae bacterium]